MPAVSATPLTDAQRDLAASAIPKAIYFAGRWATTFPAVDHNELVSAALLAVTLAAQGWRPDGGACFGVYAKRCIWNTFARLAHKRIRQERSVNPAKLARTIATTDADPAHADYWAWAMARLSPRQRSAMALRCEGRTAREAAAMMGVSKSLVIKLEQTAVQRLRELAA